MTLAVPPFNADGLLPPGRHPATVDEIKAVLVDPILSTTRAPIFERWLLHREALQSVVLVLYEWVDGSFVTDKADPGDIDVVTFFDGVDFDSRPQWQQALATSLMLGHDNKKFWGVDSFGLPAFAPADPRYGQSQSTAAYWDDLWSRVRGSTDHKGFLEVTP